MLTAQETLDALRGLGFSVHASEESLVIDGPTHLLDERRRDIIRHNKRAILDLLCCASELEAEREAIQFADTPEAQRYLDYAAQLFGPCEMKILDTPERMAQHEQGLISGAELDAWLAQCNHHPERGSWHWRGGDKCCRYCGGIYENIMARLAESATKAKSDGAATPTLF